MTECQAFRSFTGIAGSMGDAAMALKRGNRAGKAWGKGLDFVSDVRKSGVKKARAPHTSPPPPRAPSPRRPPAAASAQRLNATPTAAMPACAA